MKEKKRKEKKWNALEAKLEWKSILSFRKKQQTNEQTK